MDDLLAARCQMAVSLGFHIVFAVAGIAMPLMMVVAEALWLKTGEPACLTLAKRWAKGTTILFAVGAVSGTVLSFELGLLWPAFMRFAGAVIGMPFSLEGFAFFTEAIFLGIYLYGWDRVSRPVHLLAGVLVAISGALSGLFVVLANGWMNTPVGFRIIDGQPVDIDPLKAMFNPAGIPEAIHMLIAAYAAAGFAVAGIHALVLLHNRKDLLHRVAFAIALSLGGAASIIQPLSGDILARTVAHNQPLKLAAMECLFETRAGAPLVIGGFPDADRRAIYLGVEIPKALSLLAYHNPEAVVDGLERFPRHTWPPVATVHLAFQVMVACGIAMMLVALWGLGGYVRSKSLPDSTWFLRAVVAAAPLGVVAIETGWVVTELGRQPWVIYGIMRTKDAVSPMPGLIFPFLTITLIYLLLAAVVTWLMYRQVVFSLPGAVVVDKGADR